MFLFKFRIKKLYHNKLWDLPIINTSYKALTHSTTHPLNHTHSLTNTQNSQAYMYVHAYAYIPNGSDDARDCCFV